MKIGSVYTVDSYTTAPWGLDDAVSWQKPLNSSTEIPFGLAAIMAVLEEAGHDVQLFVFNAKAPRARLLREYIEAHRPPMFCLTSVSSQFDTIQEVCREIKAIDPSIWILVGGSHPTLAPENAILEESIDAICVGEGDDAAVEAARQIAEGRRPDAVKGLWIRDRATGAIQKNPSPPFEENLDRFPWPNRETWEEWVRSPSDECSILVGRGCPFRCTYCANHALAQISSGKFVRFRSPESIIGEIDMMSHRYPEMKRMYLEVETMGANIKTALDLFDKLAQYQERREEKLRFWLNLAVHSKFMADEAKVREFFQSCARAGVFSLNVGLESGSERIRKDVLRRPKYSNAEIIRFAELAGEHGIGLTLYVLMGVPGETVADYRETVRVVRAMNPDNVFLSIFAPYEGTDLYEITREMGLLKDGLDKKQERFKATLDLPGFSKVRIRWENVWFWAKTFHGRWPAWKVALYTVRSVIRPHPAIYGFYNYLTAKMPLVAWLRRSFGRMGTSRYTRLGTEAAAARPKARPAMAMQAGTGGSAFAFEPDQD